MSSYDLIFNAHTTAEINALLPGTNTNTSSGDSISISNIRTLSAEYITIDDNTSTTGYLSVSGDVNLASTLYVRTSQQGGGNIRIIPAVDGNEASIGFYKRNDSRDTDAGDVWICGVNSWGLGGYNIGTTVLGSCLNINSDGNVGIAYDIKTLEIMVNMVKALTAEYLTIDDNTTIPGNLSVSSFVNIGDKLTVAAAGAGGTIRCVPLVDNSESSIAFYKYIDKRATSVGDMWVSGVNSWSRPGFSIGTLTLGSCLNISEVGTISADYKIMTPLIYSNIIRANGATQITLDDKVILTANLVVNGSSNYKPYWIAGKVNTNGTILSTKGRSAFTCSRVSVGLYTITPNGSTPFSDTNYIVNLSCQVESANATSRIVNSTLSVSSFQIMTYVKNSLADCILHFRMLN